MDIIFKQASKDDLENIIENRMEFLYQVINEKPSDEFRKITHDYL